MRTYYVVEDTDGDTLLESSKDITLTDDELKQMVKGSMPDELDVNMTVRELDQAERNVRRAFKRQGKVPQFVLGVVQGKSAADYKTKFEAKYPDRYAASVPGLGVPDPL